MTAERRHFARVAFDTEARLSFAEYRQDVRVVDLSFKGALVQVPAMGLTSVGTLGLLNLRLGNGDVNIAMSVEVAHIEGTLVGLLCRTIDLDSMIHLRHLIEHNLGDPALLERELRALSAV